MEGEKEIKKRNWAKSKFTKFIRISPEAHKKLERLKGKKTIAGKADEIIMQY